MRREFHVRFCEGPEGQFLRATRLAIAFEQEADARRVMAVLVKRFAKYGLTLHPEKTKLIDFRKPGNDRKPGSFDMLGFTHFWGKSRNGWWVVQRKTSGSRFGRALQRVADWCRRNRHLPVREQHETLVKKVNGHYNYFGITGNGRALGRFFHEVTRVWRMWLDRRSRRGHVNWARFKLLGSRYPLPTPRIVHSVYQDGRQLRLAPHVIRSVT